MTTEAVDAANPVGDTAPGAVPKGMQWAQAPDGTWHAVPVKRRRNRAAVAAVIITVVALFCVAGEVVYARSRHDTVTTSGTFTIQGTHDEIFTAPNGTCTGTGGYGDINSSTQAVLRNKAGDELARASLGEGRKIDLVHCQFTFQLHTVPDRQNGDEYLLSVSHRGEESYTWDQLNTPGMIALKLG
jgi:hypothetical protein